MNSKRLVISGVLGGLVLAFLAVMAVSILREVPGTNSYALLAQSWLEGRLDTTGPCFDGDCALYEGRTYVVFPPAPGLVILPFVALFGSSFHFFLPLTILAFGLTGWLWWRIANASIQLNRDLTILLVLLVLFATPLAFVTIRGDRVWFFAQSWGTLFSTAAIYFAVGRRNGLLAGLFIALAFLSRQMTILYLPFLYILLLEDGVPLFRIDRAAWRRAFTLAAFPILGVLFYLAYNYVRFDSFTETGYNYIFPPQFDTGETAGNFLVSRVREIGIFAPAYFIFNFIYMFIAGPHVDFTGPYLTEMGGFDTNGASLFLVTPVLLWVFLGNWNRSFWWGLGTCAAILGLTLLYHSNGFSQYAAQRFTLDWLPILLLLLARALKPEHAPPLSILLAYSMLVTLAMIVLGGVLAMG
ncbi:MULTISPECIES: hypothetical protein [unclassified Devosia]|uniref:hypothetical protein n=1 Tax=unclassified Devosia TaxID=196773 RepID=UPI0015578035|nr:MULTISPECIES: hypothetical protein [unclassified Devosia]